jgi:hypothetical protein
MRNARETTQFPRTSQQQTEKIINVKAGLGFHHIVYKVFGRVIEDELRKMSERGDSLSN